MGRAGWEGWVHFADNQGTDPKHPHKCRSCGKVLPDDAVVARKHLAFHCPSFAESEDLAREAYVLSFIGTKTKLTQQEESAKNTVLKQRAKRPREEGDEYEDGFETDYGDEDEDDGGGGEEGDVGIDVAGGPGGLGGMHVHLGDVLGAFVVVWRALCCCLCFSRVSLTNLAPSNTQKN